MTDTPAARIAARMKKRRLELGLSQEEVAHRIPTGDVVMRDGKPTPKFFTMRSYARWERLEATGFLKRLDVIAKALETTESELLGGEDPIAAQSTKDEIASKFDMIFAELDQQREDLTELLKKLDDRAGDQ
jgi:transcriptional regulator with XRE-family HTH domain